MLTTWGPPLFMMAAIFFLSSQPEIPAPPDPLLRRIVLKSAHAIGYGMLAVSYARVLHGYGIRHIFPAALALTLLYALSDEWHQTFVPGRTGSLLDVLIDLSGAVIALLSWQRLKNRLKFYSSP